MITNLPISGKWSFNTSTRKLYFRGVLVNPSFFSPRPSGIHGAVDIAAAVNGDDLRALIKMKGKRVSYDKGWGRYYRGTGTDGHDYLRAHMSRVTAKEGVWIPGGGKIGDCDCTGNCSGSHDHLEKWWVPGNRSTRVDLYWELCWLTQTVIQKQSKRYNPYPVPSMKRVIQIGDVGYPVMWVQWALGVQAINGKFGSGVRTAVKRFQAKHGLKQTGVVNMTTFNKMKAVTR